jgi:hypothetical protein
MAIDNVGLLILDTNSVNSTIEGSSMTIQHKIGATEGYGTYDTIGPPGPEFSTQQLRINTLVDGNELSTDARPTNSVSTFTAYLSCMDQNFDGGTAFPKLQLGFNLRDTNLNYDVVVIIPAFNTVSGRTYSNSFLLSPFGTNLFLPQINVMDASLNAYKSITGDNVGYYGIVNATPIVVPEPSSGVLLALGLAATLGYKRAKEGVKQLFGRGKKASKL